MKSKLLPLLLLFSVHAFAQDSVFQIKDYKFRTPGFRALTLGLNFSGSTIATESKSGKENSSKSFSLSPSQISYIKLISTDKRLHQSTVGLNPIGNFQKQTIDRKDIKNRNVTSFFIWDRNDRFYKNKNLFFEFGNTLRNEFYHQNRKDTVVNFLSNRFNVNNTITIGIGKGRIERVQDAQMALYILNNLQAQGLLNAAVTADKAYELAQIITDINTKRIFDFRRRRIYELARLDSFLRSSGLVTQTDIRHFTTVNDNWALAFNPYRLSGSNWYVRVKPGIGFGHDRQDEKTAANNFLNKRDKFIISISPVAGYEKYVPVNLKWQLNMGTSLSYQHAKNKDRLRSITNGTPSNYDFTYFDNLWIFTGFYGVGYFPSTRTQLTANLNLDATLLPNAFLTIAPSINFECNYFVSYRTYLRANFNINYEHSADQTNIPRDLERQSVNTNLSLSLSHIIF